MIVNVDTLILRSHDSEWTPTPTPMGALIICNLASVYLHERLQAS